ncbi:MAG: SpoIIE family protein phosphatase [Candidatus Aminicenantes bacterium]|nr:SpoIIE family protein phosphatase [Candidatus Aminicenantes bacterium]
MPKLYIYPKKGDSFNFTVDRPEISIGRSPDNTLAVPDPFCSGRHAIIVSAGDRFFVRDNNSKNGVFVNGKRVAGEEEVHPGDEILVGSTRVSFDQEILTHVEILDTPESSSGLSMAVPLQDILKPPDIQTTIRAAMRETDLASLRSEQRVLGVMKEVSQALILHKPLGELLEHIMDLICQNLPMDRGVLLLKEGNPIQLIPKVIRVNTKNLQNQRFLLSRSIVNMAFQDQLAVLSSDAATDPRFMSHDSIIRSNIHSAMCAPLWNNQEVIGIVYADRVSLMDQFSEEDLKMLTLLSNLAAIKIENARLIEKALEQERMEKELDLAAQIQRDFLPKASPPLEHFDIHGINVPCQQVGGDYFDYIPIAPELLGLVIADVSGKGVSASLLMASLRASLHAQVTSRHRLEDMAKKLNDFVCHSSGTSSFITFFYGELNTATGEMRYLNAGHNPPVIINARGRLDRLEACGLCLGMFPASEYECRSARIEAGDAALLYTDGITESRNKVKEEYGEERLIDFVRLHLDQPAAKIIEGLRADLAAFTQSPDLADDMTVVLVKRKA